MLLASVADDARRLVATYLILVFGLSVPSYWPIIAAGTSSTNGGLFILTLMWTPGVAALLTTLIHRRTVKGLGWRLGKAKYLLIAYALPIAYCVAVYVPVWALIPGSFEVSSVITSVAPSVGGYIAVMATLGIVQSLVTALGEEIGWRGLLVPQLARLTSFRNTALISGLIWAAWHSPILLFADYNAGAPAAYSLVCFTVMVVGISFAFAWLRLSSGSLWTGALLHASHNLFVQGIFDLLTRPNDTTIYVTGEFGIGLAVAGLVVAYVFWRVLPLRHSEAVSS